MKELVPEERKVVRKQGRKEGEWIYTFTAQNREYEILDYPSDGISILHTKIQEEWYQKVFPSEESLSLLGVVIAEKGLWININNPTRGILEISSCPQPFRLLNISINRKGQLTKIEDTSGRAIESASTKRGLKRFLVPLKKLFFIKNQRKQAVKELSLLTKE